MSRPNVGREPIETWEHAGLACAIEPNNFGALNGYVQLPKEALSREIDYDEIVVEVHGGLTYGVDRDGWVGFDTVHGGDSWPREIILRYADERRKGNDFFAFERSHPSSWTVNWTIEKLRAEINSLADQLSVYDFSKTPSVTEDA